MRQDAFLWQCLETICRAMNMLIVEERNKLASKGK